MKKLIIAAFFMIITTAESFAGPIVSFYIEFGHLNAENVCVERGICHWGGGVNRNIVGNINDNTGNLDVTFQKSALPRNTVETQFVDGIFEVPVAYQLSQDLCQKLGVANFTIKAGKYKVIETAGQYKISFTK